MKYVGNERLEWRRISEKEKLRRKSLDQLRKVMQETEVGTKKTPKSLLLVVLHGQGITVNDAANMLSVNREVILNWMRLLKDRKLMETEGSEALNPVMKPTKALLEKLRLYKQKRGAGAAAAESAQEGFKQLERDKKEFTNEREDRIRLSEELDRKDAELREKEKELDREHNIRTGLEEQIKRLEGQMRGGETSEVDGLRAQLERERKERVNVEELLKKDREELRKARQEISERYIQKERTLSEREKNLVEREKAFMENEELDILFGEEGEYETLLSKSKKLLDILHKRLLERKEKPIEGRTEEEIKEVIEEEEEVSRLLTEDAQQLKLKRRALIEGGLETEGEEARPIEGIRAVPDDIRELVKLLERRRSVRVPDAAETLGVSEDRISEWIIKLTQKKAIQVRKHIAGGDEIILPDKTDVRRLKEELDSEEMERELRKVMEEEKQVK